MEKAVYRNLGRRSSKVLLGPSWGLDNGVVAAGRNRVLIVTVDPVSVIPQFGVELSAWTSVHLIASDYATSGARPAFATFSYNFPPSMRESEQEEYVAAVGRECGRLGVSIVAGHTGTYPGSGFTVVGSGSMFGFCNAKGYVSPRMARIGDAILLTKHAAIEATASLAICFPSYTDKKVGTKIARRAREMIRKATTVADALTAAGEGLGKAGVTSMHDATEGGVLGALQEMAGASRHRFEVNRGNVAVPQEVQEVCLSFGVDPLTAMGEGALLITCHPGRVGNVRRALSGAGIACQRLGEVKSGMGLWVAEGDGPRTRFESGRDGYWDAYDRSVAAGLG